MDEKILVLTRKRYQLLETLYEKTHADPSQWIEDTELQNDLSLTPQEYTPMILELHSRHLVKCTHQSATIDFAGIREVERLKSNPNQGTAYFPSIYIMTGDISNSQIQQGSHQSTQSMQVTQNDLASLLPFILKLEKTLGTLNLNAKEEKQAKVDIATVQAQASADHPNRTILRESLRSLRTILEAAAGGAAAGPAGELLRQLLQYGASFFGAT